MSVRHTLATYLEQFFTEISLVNQAQLADSARRSPR